MRITRAPYVAARLLLLRRTALRRGVFGNDPLWRVVAILLFGFRLLKWLLVRHPEIVTTERLRPGQAIALRAIPAVSRRERRRAASGR